MARDVTDDIYYVSTGGKIPVRWTAPEVDSYMLNVAAVFFKLVKKLRVIKFTYGLVAK